MRCLRLPEELREALGRGFIGVRACGQEALVTGVLLELLDECAGAVVVGDYICSKLLGSGYLPNVCVVDGVTRRGITWQVGWGRFDRVLRCRNPRSHICREAEEGVAEAIRLAEGGARVLLVVEGEEDLLALAAMMGVRSGWCVAYGLPGCGAELVFVNDDVRAVARGILGLFEEVELPELPR